LAFLVDLDRLHARLAGIAGFATVPRAALAVLPAEGVAHDHVLVRGTGWLLRVPRMSQFALDPAANLAYQAACFERLGPSGHAPRLGAVLAPGTDLPMGALLVEAIDGRPAALPGDLPAIARALAAIHALPVPPPPARPPLADHPDPVGATVAVIEDQARYFPRAVRGAGVRAALARDLDWARDLARDAAGRAQPVTLVGTDTHPGNFLIDAAGRAVFVDLEKALYGAPAIDAAHATLPTSVLWGVPGAAPLPRRSVLAFERAWLAALPPPLAEATRPWLRPLRRLTWLRSMTWFARWRVLSARSTAWSAAALDPALAARIRDRVRLFFTPGFVAAARADWEGTDPLPPP